VVTPGGEQLLLSLLGRQQDPRPRARLAHAQVALQLAAAFESVIGLATNLDRVAVRSSHMREEVGRWL